MQWRVFKIRLVVARVSASYVLMEEKYFMDECTYWNIALQLVIHLLMDFKKFKQTLELRPFSGWDNIFESMVLDKLDIHLQ